MASESPIAAAQAMAQVRAVRLALIGLHKVLVDGERRRYERSRGRIESPHHALQLLMGDPFFAWLRPMAQLIIQFDEWLADEHGRRVADAAALVDAVSQLLSKGGPFDPFATEYRRALQDNPDVVLAHARTMGLIGRPAPPGASASRP